MYSIQRYSASFPNTASLVSSKFISPFWVFVCFIGIYPLHGSHVVFYIPLQSTLWLFLFHNNCCMIHGWCSSTVAWFMYRMIQSPLMMWIGYSLHLHGYFSPSFPCCHHHRFSFYPSFPRSKFVESFLYFVFLCLLSVGHFLLAVFLLLLLFFQVFVLFFGWVVLLFLL